MTTRQKLPETTAEYTIRWLAILSFVGMIGLAVIGLGNTPIVIYPAAFAFFGLAAAYMVLDIRRRRAARANAQS